ncbi:jhy protein homolog [Phaenicophaeus curvirostris]|uniref:jhy protein homolog n=1 Tax=Phaenicophaeus curvirostris TaxID=33595 RepID=UPI0037F0CD89
MNSSKYVAVSSPHTYNMSKKHISHDVLVQCNFHPANWKRRSVGERVFASSLHDSQESASESRVQERQDQSEPQLQIHENEELVGLDSDELENDSLEDDSLEEMSLKEQEGDEYDTNQHTNGIQRNDGDGRKQQSVDKYFSLRYNPNWKNTRDAAEFSVTEKAHQVAQGSSMDFSQDSFYLHSNGSPEEKSQPEAKSQDSFSGFGTELLSFHEPNAVVSNDPSRLPAKGKGPADSCHLKDSPSTRSSALSLQIKRGRPQRAKTDFVKRNKQTLGLHLEINSYFQLYSKKQAVLQEQVADPKTVDDEPVQRVLPFQTVKMEPEDKWYPKSQQLKDHQRNKIKSNQSLKERAVPRNDSQWPPVGRAEPKPCHNNHCQISQFQTAPMQAVEQNSSAQQKCLFSSPSVGPDTNRPASTDTCFNNFPNSRCFVNQDFTSTCRFHPTLHKFNPMEDVSPAHISKENMKCQHHPPNGLPQDQQHLDKHAALRLFAGDECTKSQTHPKQRNSSSTFNASFQESMKSQVSRQNCKGHVCVDKRPSQSSARSSPKAPPCTTSQIIQIMERHYEEIIRLAEADLADRNLFSLLPPIIPQVASGLEVDLGSGEGNQVKISQRNSEGHPMQTEERNQPKVSKKPCSSKTYMNLNVKLGGLGPDYEAIKEKKEKLKQQKEYAKQIKEHNMKNIASVQRVPTKPQTISLLSRQKALEYAKKIPRPKTFAIRQSDEEVKEERIPPWTLNEDSLPQITSLETLQNRHEKEKQIVAAFRTLHIL